MSPWRREGRAALITRTWARHAVRIIQRAEANDMARVLIVDDTDIVRKALELAVRKMGHDARSTPSARKALELAIADPPDLALLDFRMPEMNGVALYGAMQAALGARCPAVLFVSATPPEEVRAKSPPELKPAGYVRKPFQLQDLSEKVGEVLGT